MEDKPFNQLAIHLNDLLCLNEIGHICDIKFILLAKDPKLLPSVQPLALVAHFSLILGFESRWRVIKPNTIKIEGNNVCWSGLVACFQGWPPTTCKAFIPRNTLGCVLLITKIICNIILCQVLTKS